MATKAKKPKPPITEDWQKLAESSKPLPYWVIDTYFPYVRRLSIEDQREWEAEGLLALTVAARRYAPDSGFAFSTFATTCIQNHFRGYWRSMHTLSRGSGAAVASSLSNLRPESSEEYATAHNSALVVSSGVSDFEVRSDVKTLLKKAKLTVVERRILYWRFWKEATLEVVATKLAITKEWVRMLQLGAMAKVQRAANRSSR